MPTQQDIYGKIEAGKVIEFPVTVPIIEARGHTVYQYSPVCFEAAPSYHAPTEKLAQTLKVVNNVIHVSYMKQPKALEEILNSFRISPVQRKLIQEIDGTTQRVIQTLIEHMVENQINRLGAQRGYSTINNALSRYTNSSVDTFKKEAAFIQAALDAAWTNLIAYMQDVQSGQRPVPVTVAEVEAVLAIPTWADFK